MGKAYQLKIIIEKSEPLVWRRVVVPNFINFAQLHEIIQTIFGWEDDHLHEFYFPSTKILIPGSAPFDDVSDYENIRIVELVERVKWFRYIYDFGDNWMHKIIVEKKLEDFDYAYPQVIKFKGENFEEDSGGVFLNWEDELDESIRLSGREPYTLEDINAKLQRRCCFKGERKAIIKNADKIGQDDFDRIEIIMEPIEKNKKIYPNDLCSCRSGKKYKRCCGS